MKVSDLMGKNLGHSPGGLVNSGGGIVAAHLNGDERMFAHKVNVNNLMGQQ